MPLDAPFPRRRHRAARPLAALVAIACIALGLSACSASGSAAKPEGATRTVVDVEGTEVEVPVRPERVVALSEPTLDGALALGVTPVGTISGRGQRGVPNYLADLAGDIPILGGVAQPNFDVIANAEPDLILVDGTSINNNPEAMTILRRIAPTFYAGYAGGDWRATFTKTADALNLSDRATEVIADYDAAVVDARKKLTAYTDDTFSIVRWQGGSASLILNELPAGIALTDLGLHRPPNQDRRGRGHSEPVSLENLADIDADHLFFGTLGGSSNGNPDAGGSSDVSGAEQALRQAEKVPGFTALGAYRAERILPVDGSLWTSTGGPILMQRLVTDVLRILS